MDRVASCTGWIGKNYDPEYYKIVFMSSAEIGVPFLQELKNDKRFDVVGVVSMPDAASGRGMKMKENIIKSETKNLFGIPPTPFNKGGEDIEIDKKLIKERWLITTGFHLPYNPELKERSREMRNNPTEPENKLWKDFLQQQKYTVNRQKIIDNYIVDFYIASKKLVIEIDWEVHNNQESKWYDKTRDNLLRWYNLNVLRFTNDEILNNFEKVCEKIYTFTPPLEKGDTGGFSDFIQTPNKINPEKSEEGKEFTEWLKAKQPDFLVVIAYGKIIPQTILDIPNFWSINVHGSLLPEYRGASPLQSVFLDNKKEAGLTIMKMDAGLDSGNMIDKLKFKIPFERTVKDLIEKLQTKWPKFLNETIWKYGKKILWEEFQDEKKATHCKKIEKEDGLLDINKDTLEKIYSKYRAYFLWPKLYFIINNEDSSKSKRVIIEKLILNEKTFLDNKDKMLFEWKTLNACVEEIILKPEGKKWMDRKSFAAGYLR